jgi:hypothetical protein
MNRQIFAAILILAGYIYGSTLYEPWYFTLQGWLVTIGILNMPENAPENTRLMGNQVQIIIAGILLIGAGIWLFVFSVD